MRWKVLLGTICLLSSWQINAEIYRWVDENGKKHFSDKPPSQLTNNKKTANAADRVQHIARRQNLDSLQERLPAPSRQDSSGLKIKTWLKQGQFSQLNQYLSNLQVDTEKNIQREKALFQAYESFSALSPRATLKLDAWIKAEPDNYIPYLARAEYLRHMGWKARGNSWASETSEGQFKGMREYFQKASVDLEKALQLKPNSLPAYYSLLDMAGALGNEQAEAAVLGAAMKVAPASYQMRRLYVLRLAPRWGGSHEAMRSFALESLKYTSDNPRLKILQAFEYYDQANIQKKQEAYSLAEELYDKALSFGPDDRLYFARALNRMKRKDYSGAISDLTHAIELNPEDGDYYFRRGRAYEKIEHFGKAYSDALLAEELKPGDKYIHRLRGRLAGQFEHSGFRSQKQHNYSNALAQYETALQLKPSSVLYHRKAEVLVKLNKLDAALQATKTSIRLDQTYMSAYHMLDYLLAKRRDWSQIISYWDQYIRLDPINARAYLERGGAYFHKGDIRQAVADAKMAADLGSIEGKEVYEKYRHRIN